MSARIQLPCYGMDAKGLARRALPSRAYDLAWRVRRELWSLALYRGRHECPVCGNRRRFVVINTEGGRHETLCVPCGSLERHRRTILLLSRYTDLLSTQRRRLLHVAPERCLRHVFEGLSLDYVTGDLEMPEVHVKLDVTAIPFPDRSFDAILCSHVLEHVLDDVQAMREMRRVLKDDGWVLVNVPADPKRAEAYEDPSVTDPADRMQIFGQHDHVRIYAVATVVGRLRESGFSVTVDPINFSEEERRRYLLSGDIGWDHSYFCRPA
jgi:predicted SAM-dependent methyltransferase